MPSQIDNTFHALMYYFTDIVNTWYKKCHVQKLSKFKFQNKKTLVQDHFAIQFKVLNNF